MKYTLLIVFAILSNSTLAQDTKEQFFGIWKITNHKLSDGTDCLKWNSATYTFNEDGTYVLDMNGYKTYGKWKIEKDSIIFFDSRLENPKDGLVADHSYRYSGLTENKFFLEQHLCSEEEANKSTYEKQ